MGAMARKKRRPIGAPPGNVPRVGFVGAMVAQLSNVRKPDELKSLARSFFLVYRFPTIHNAAPLRGAQNQREKPHDFTDSRLRSPDLG